MKHKITTPERPTQLDSRNYTLNRTAGLRLFFITFLDDDLEWESDYVGFWATSKKTAYRELKERLKVFESYGLNEFSETDTPLKDEKVIAWLNHYSTIDRFTLEPGLSMAETVLKAVEFNNHITYVLRKMCEMVSHIKECEKYIENT